MSLNFHHIKLTFAAIHKRVQPSISKSFVLSVPKASVSAFCSSNRSTTSRWAAAVLAHNGVQPLRILFSIFSVPRASMSSLHLRRIFTESKRPLWAAMMRGVAVLSSSSFFVSEASFLSSWFSRFNLKDLSDRKNRHEQPDKLWLHYQ